MSRFAPTLPLYIPSKANMGAMTTGLVSPRDEAADAEELPIDVYALDQGQEALELVRASASPRAPSTSMALLAPERRGVSVRQGAAGDLAPAASMQEYFVAIDTAMTLAEEAKIEALAKGIVNASRHFDPCELDLLALRFTQGFEPRWLGRSMRLLLSATAASSPEVHRYALEAIDLRSVGETQKAVRQASLNAILMLMPFLDRVMKPMIVASIMRRFKGEELITALTRVSEHLTSDETFDVARDGVGLLPETSVQKQSLGAKRASYYEACIRYLLRVLPRLCPEQEAELGLCLSRYAHLGPEGAQERLRSYSGEALLRHYCTDRDLVEFEIRGITEHVANALANSPKD